MPLDANEFSSGDVTGTGDVTYQNIVIFHHPCQDGFAAAFVCHLGLTGSTYYWPMGYDHDAHRKQDFADWSVFEGRNVYIVDFSLPISVLKKLGAVAEKVVVCDHHQSFAKAIGDALGTEVFDAITSPVEHSHIINDLAPNVTIYFAPDLCGAQVTHATIPPRIPVPELDQYLAYVAGRDLWKWDQPKNKEVCAYLDLIPRTFAEHAALLVREGGFRKAAAVGKLLLDQQNRRVEAACKTATMATLKLGWTSDTIPVVNASQDASEIGNRLLEVHSYAPYAAVYCHRGGLCHWSLRGRKDGVNVATIAKRFGGGGHAAAAGFTTELGACVIGPPS